MASDHLPEHVLGLLQSQAYPSPPDRVELIQTHISYVLLAGDRVYKLRKAVDLGFLDFTTLEARRKDCEAEVHLNRRTCGQTYVGVVPVTREGDGYRVGGTGKPIDYAVEMRKLPAEGMMDRLVARDALTHEMLGRLVALLADFHRNAETSDRIRAIGGHEGLAADWHENFEQTRAFIGQTISGSRFERLQAYVDAYLERERPLLLEREVEGRIRDGHGDLRTDSICFDPTTPSGICVYDCIEFNERFRYGDTGLDAAFLAMDLDFRGRDDLSDLFVGLYSAAAGDARLPLLLHFYKCYRAFVRGKVESMLQAEEEVPAAQSRAARRRAREYFQLAEKYARTRPFRGLLLVMGLTGAGKSVLAGSMAARLGAVYLSTDVVRKRGEGLATTESGREAVDSGRYAPAARQRVYEELFQTARATLDEDRGAVLDGTYLTPDLREPALKLATERRQPLLVVECSAPESVIRARQGARIDQRWTASDAGWEVYLAQKGRYEPPIEVPPNRRMTVNTSLPLQQQIAAVLERLRARRSR